MSYTTMVATVNTVLGIPIRDALSMTETELVYWFKEARKCQL